MSMRDLIVSIHIPKTAGTAFADVLVRNFGRSVGFYYGPNHPKTHPRLRALRSKVDSEQLAQIKEAGIGVIHGHFSVSRFRSALPDPANYWIWLRDPIERLVSEYYFNKNRSNVINPVAKALHEQDLSLADYARQKRAGNLQSRNITPFDIKDFGFIGITELYDECIALSGLDPAPRQKRIQNVSRNKQPVSIEDRRAIARRNIGDIALYSAALQRIVGERGGKKT